MDKLISLGIALTSFVFYKILEYFHLFRFLQVILALLMFVAICYGISPILKLFGFFAFDFTDSFSFSSTSEKEKEKKRKEDLEKAKKDSVEVEYKTKKSELEWKRSAGNITQREDDNLMKDLNNEYGKSGW